MKSLALVSLLLVLVQWSDGAPVEKDESSSLMYRCACGGSGSDTSLPELVPYSKYPQDYDYSDGQRYIDLTKASRKMYPAPPIDPYPPPPRFPPRYPSPGGDDGNIRGKKPSPPPGRRCPCVPY
ncbi:WW domain-binding protein 2-like [Argiope bruennichi]|uniref:Uncharacterized protein n=1 Tax=Argiope bruennichi TaxID=94029 RepID=A0A8T0FAF2_ARGBR|nr:WW domain-binding protein 2-like [Argiope bruennichi]KAF8788237.1 hypothetical protein HNY73_009767 [Argiope bruennichi]